MAEHPRYRITERVDAGGMAEVFRGVAESMQGFKKSVAIKRILPNLTKNKKFISMFLDEARLSLHLQHANIVGVFDIGVAPPEGGNPGSYFIVMEFVDGANLKAILESLRRQGRRLRVAQTVYILMEVCKGLAYAHEFADPETGNTLGIVHRDISPPNILLSKMGEVKLVDFGLAKATSQLESTDPGVVKGKFSYLAPEAAHGKEVDRRADIFAVGILLYEMLTGKRLFYGETDYQTVELVRQARVPSVAQQNHEVEPELEAVVRKALAKDPEQRYQHAAELLDALAQYLFSRALKVTSRDIAQLVLEVVRERRKSLPAVPQVKSLIDQLIQDELLKFTSLENLSGDSPSPAGAPQHVEDDGSRPLDAGSFIDTRTWGMDDGLDGVAGELGGGGGGGGGGDAGGGAGGGEAPFAASRAAQVKAVRRITGGHPVTRGAGAAGAGAAGGGAGAAGAGAGATAGGAPGGGAIASTAGGASAARGGAAAGGSAAAGGASTAGGSVAGGRASAGRPVARDPSGVHMLGDELESGDGGRSQSGLGHSSISSTLPGGGASNGRGLWIALAALVVASGTAVYYLVATHVIGH